MKLLNLLTPKFLKNLDDYFLLNYRLLWITKVHYVLYYGALVALGSSALVWAYPLHTYSSLPETGFVLFLAILFSLPAAIFWVYKQAIYSVEKNYGSLFPFMEQLRFGAYILCFTVFLGLPIYFTSLVESKIMNLESSEQLSKDAYDLNAGNPYFPSNDNGDAIWEEDKEVIRNWHDQYQFPQMSDGRNYYNFMPFYVDYSYKRAESGDDVLTFRNLFLNTNTEEKKLQLIENFITAHNKYSAEKITISAKEALAAYKAHQIILSRSNYYSYKYEISSNMSLISRTHYYPFTRTSDFWLVIICFIFGLSTLLSVFQNVKWQDFVLGAISFGAMALVYGISVSFVESVTNSNGVIFLTGLSSAFVFFLFKSYQINSLQAFSRPKIFALMFANALSPFILFIFGSLLNVLFGFSTHISDNNLWMGFLGGMFIHVLIFMPFFRKMYLKMKALPRV
ncbi:MAG: hypothetical protein EAZ08_04470 [Cytophagales bacterium]|nr:MAG: hypothetical protein EAZ08_04470 [Cytophagales bacterium]